MRFCLKNKIECPYHGKDNVCHFDIDSDDFKSAACYVNPDEQDSER